MIAQKVFALGGLNGDVIIVLPAFRHIHDTTGEKPMVVTTSKFAPIFDGVSYVKTAVVEDEKADNYDAIKKYCKANGLAPRFLRFWMNKDDEQWPDAPMGMSDSTVSFRGKEYYVNFTRWKSYQHAIFDRTGVPLELINKLPLVFDNRNRSREKRLVADVQSRNKKGLPLLLSSMVGHTSALAARPEVEAEINSWADKYFIVDMSKVVAEKPYDLLGLFDAAALLVTIDTMHLHLVAASPLRFIAFLHDANGDWGMSVPSGKCLTSIRYSKAAKRINKLHNYISSAYHTGV